MTKVIASTSGIVMATTRPGQMSIRSGLVCRPRLMKLTASTTTIASSSTLTNSPTDRLTASGWSCTWDSSSPTGSSAFRLATSARNALPRAMMSPPLAIETPSATTSRPWWRTSTCGGSA